MSGLSMRDRAAIEELLARAAWAWDARAAAEYVACLHPDAELSDAEGGMWRGAQEISRALHEHHADPGRRLRQQHHDQLQIAPDPDGREGHWLVRSYLLVSERREHPPHALVWAGYQQDVVCRHAGNWVFRSRHAAPWDGEILSGFEQLPR